MRAVTVGNLRFRVDPAQLPQRKESHKQIPLGLKPARNDKRKGHNGTTEVVPSRRALPSCPPVVPSHTVRRGTLEPYPDANRDYAFAACDKRVASSYIALKSERCRILSAPGSLRIWSSN